MALNSEMNKYLRLSITETNKKCEVKNVKKKTIHHTDRLFLKNQLTYVCIGIRCFQGKHKLYIGTLYFTINYCE